MNHERVKVGSRKQVMMGNDKDRTVERIDHRKEVMARRG